MPFCRKCGRRLTEYSESCPDCGQSTTAPMINTKRNQNSNIPRVEAKIIKAARPVAAPVIKLKVAPKKPTHVAIPVKVVAPVKVITTKQQVTAAQLNAPIKVATPPKFTEETKPVLSSKHIVKSKKAKQRKPADPFSINFARPVAGLEVPQRKPSSRPATRKPVVYVAPSLEQLAVQPVPITPSLQPVAEPEPPTQPTQTTIITPAFKPNPTQPKLSPKPVIRAEALAPLTIEPHEILKSNVSLKEDIINNPNDYEKQPFAFDLKCPNGHYWLEGELLPVSKGVAFCLKCGERLSKPRSKKRRRRQKFP